MRAGRRALSCMCFIVAGWGGRVDEVERWLLNGLVARRRHTTGYTRQMEFEWDPGKAAENLRKHKVSFNEAATVFGDDLGITASDPDHSSQEHRYITVGLSSRGRVLMVAHTERRGRIRIISARKLTRNEKFDYAETQQ